MSRLVAVISTDEGAALAPEVQARLLDAVRVQQGAGESGSDHDRDRAELWSEGGVVLGVRRAAWELGASFSGPVLVVEDHDCVVVADATLYYRDELRRRLAAHGVRPRGQTASHLILAAYRAWGSRCAEHLEGDFSFVVWDRRRRTVTAARDFAGRRPLYYTTLADGTLLLASTLAALLEHPHCTPELDLVAIAEAAAGYVSPAAATCYKGTFRLLAGRTLTRGPAGAVRIDTHWEPPSFQSGSALSFDDAAEELRELLCASTRERLARTGTTAVWMSGGRDSTAVFAAGQQTIRSRGLNGALMPVSITYPEEDPGHEDEVIRAVAARWNSPVRWLSIADIPFLGASCHRAAARDEPFAHFFEEAQRALARTTVEAGARVALDGVGGDQLFLLSWSYLSDLLRTGHWLALRRAWRDLGLAGSGFRSFVHWAVQPMLGPSLLLRSGMLRRGRPLRGWLRQRLPPWVYPHFGKAHGVSEFAPMLPERRRGERVSSTESRSYFTDPFFSTIYRLGAACALEHGVEVRSPLYDRRIIAFAATRPRSDHTGDTDGKRLLRRAMCDLLPEEVVAARPERTGIPSDYVARAVHELAERAVPEHLGAPTTLADLGIVDPTAFERARASMVRRNRPELTLPFFATVQTELWLRSRTQGGASRRRPVREQHVDASTTEGSRVVAAIAS